VVVSISNHESALGVEALQLGAISVVQKSTALATDQLYEVRDTLVRAVREAALARTFMPQLRAAAPVRTPPPATACKLVVIGTSTGGPQALTQLLAALPAGFPVPILIALHIPAGYTEELSKRLDRNSAIDVAEAEEGVVLRPGLALLARGGMHLTIGGTTSTPHAQLGAQHFNEPHKPSVDVLFESAAARIGAGVLGVVLTGMGNDGLRGSRAIVAAGGRVVTEAEGSCVVYGMPWVVKEAGLSHAEARLEDMAQLIVGLL
jgi:two-component system chemotaxis response regulator CheB